VIGVGHPGVLLISPWKYNIFMKTLETPIADRLLDPLGRLLTPDVARKVANYRFDAKSQARIDKLARKCNEGQLTDEERREYETYVQTIDFIAILQAKARSRLKSSTNS
jgi:uncharacterized protein YnzC (UPF0291/DUF896 family)